MRPFQFLSLLALIQEGIEATTREDIVKNSPSVVLSKSKIFNLINALHFQSLFGLNLIDEHKPTSVELKQAKELYEEFKEYQNDKAPGEEYELVQHWGEDLHLDGYFQLVPESSYKRKTPEQVIDEIESDPYGLESIDPSKERKMKKFIKEHSNQDINMAVTMYMVSALNYFSKFDKAKIKSIAFEFATLGMGGIHPEKEGYSVPSIKGEKFTGYKALAFYYVSWALAIPEMLSQLQMPFGEEYSMAKKLQSL